MVQIDAGSKEAKVLRVLLEKYPVDTGQVAEGAGLSRAEAERTLKGMEDRGWIELERLPDRTFVRLRRADFTFIGRVETQKRAIKHKGKRKDKDRARQRVLRDDHDDMMYA